MNIRSRLKWGIGAAVVLDGVVALWLTSPPVLKAEPEPLITTFPADSAVTASDSDAHVGDPPAVEAQADPSGAPDPLGSLSEWATHNKEWLGLLIGAVGALIAALALLPQFRSAPSALDPSRRTVQGSGPPG